MYVKQKYACVCIHTYLCIYERNCVGAEQSKFLGSSIPSIHGLHHLCAHLLHLPVEC